MERIVTCYVVAVAYTDHDDRLGIMVEKKTTEVSDKSRLDAAKLFLYHLPHRLGAEKSGDLAVCPHQLWPHHSANWHYCAGAVDCGNLPAADVDRAKGADCDGYYLHNYSVFSD